MTGDGTAHASSVHPETIGAVTMVHKCERIEDQSARQGMMMFRLADCLSQECKLRMLPRLSRISRIYGNLPAVAGE